MTFTSKAYASLWPPSLSVAITLTVNQPAAWKLWPIIRSAGCPGEVVVVQRRYQTQRSEPRHDAVMRFDPRTAIPMTPHHGERPVLRQPQWLIAAYDALKHRRANLQLQVGAVFPYDKCRVTQERDVVDAVAEVWLACEPVVGVLRRASRIKPAKARRKK